MFDNFEIHRITANGCDIACVAAGEGEPVLMLHGFPSLWPSGRKLPQRLLVAAIGLFARTCVDTEPPEAACHQGSVELQLSYHGAGPV